jgi:hypothetical protein
MNTPAVMERFEETLLHDAAAMRRDRDALYDALPDFSLALDHVAVVMAGGNLSGHVRTPRSPRLGLRLHEFVLDGLTGTYDPELIEAGLSAIGSVVLPLTGIPSPTVAPRGVEMNRRFLSGCKLAEPRFDDVLQATLGIQPANQAIINVYHDETRTPILLQKAEEPSALVLEPLTITGLDDGTSLHTNDVVHVPAGSLVAVDGCARAYTGEIHDATAYDGTELATWTFDGVTIHPMRLSAWAYPDEGDRQLLAIIRSDSAPYDLSVDKVRADMLRETTLDDFRGAARYVMDACGVPPAS